ncbi:GNAT family N-acetyltransferase [Clostridium sp. Marseille-P299]|uniref:GNAT family N-acetyltransferase n=1 Tax=Clostridium sp. Marseille-P299 TaxID=1805477 RepID=UPI000AED85F1|nr:GNAT family N-acetyltransferase [Clostridium sp. Marseille-P299]
MQFMLKTERLVIQPYSHDYLEDYFKEFTDEITKFQYPDSFSNIESARKLVSEFLMEMEKGNMLELVILSQQGEFLGSMEAFNIKEKTPEVGLWIKKSAHGKGYGYEALKALIEYLDSKQKYKYYVYEVDIKNTQSLHLVNKFLYNKGNYNEVITESGKKLTLDTYFILPNSDNN